MTPLYTSPPAARGIGGRYSVYRDGVELVLRFLDEGIRIPADQVRDVRLVTGGLGAFLLGVLRGRYPWPSVLWALVLDLGVRGPHILMRTGTGPVRYFHFTPEEPERFLAACRAMMGQPADPRS